MNILGKRVVLRAIEEQDLRQLHQWANDPEIWQNLGGWHFPSSFDSMAQWFAGLKNDQLNHRFAIETLEDKQLIGTANLVAIDWKNRHAFHGMMLGSTTSRSKGYGLDTVMAVMRFAFDELNLERLDSDIIEYNQPSVRLYVGKCGWKEEGRLRRWHFRKGRYWDKIMVGIIRDDYARLIADKPYFEPDRLT